MTSLQQRLVKTGGRLIKHARYYWQLLAESHLTRRLSPPNAKPVTFATTGNTAEQNRLKPFTRKPFEVSNELELESQKGNPG